MTTHKPNVIFIGSFVDEAKDGSVGGQMFACRSIVNSKVSDHVNFLLIDSTVDRVPVPPLYQRFYKVIPRFLLLFKYLLTKKVDKVLIFCSAGPSFIEKGLAAIICKLFFQKDHLCALLWPAQRPDQFVVAVSQLCTAHFQHFRKDHLPECGMEDLLLLCIQGQRRQIHCHPQLDRRTRIHQQQPCLYQYHRHRPQAAVPGVDRRIQGHLRPGRSHKPGER